jgi:hypothetical protein
LGSTCAAPLSVTFGIHKLMRFVFLVIGAAGIVVVALLFFLVAKGKPEFWCYSLGGVAALAAAGVLLVAGLKRYRGHWPFLIGTLLIAVGFAGFGTDIDDYLKDHSSEDVVTGIFWSVTFWVMGVLLLFSGQKMHRCLVELESRRQSAKNQDAEPAAPPNRGPAERLGSLGGGPPSVS